MSGLNSNLSDGTVMKCLDSLHNYKKIIAYLFLSKSDEKFDTPFGRLFLKNGQVVLDCGSHIFVVKKKFLQNCVFQDTHGNQRNMDTVCLPEEDSLLCENLPPHVGLTPQVILKIQDILDVKFEDAFTVLAIPMSLRNFLTGKVVKQTESSVCPDAPLKVRYFRRETNTESVKLTFDGEVVRSGEEVSVLETRYGSDIPSGLTVDDRTKRRVDVLASQPDDKKMRADGQKKRSKTQSSQKGAGSVQSSTEDIENQSPQKRTNVQNGIFPAFKKSCKPCSDGIVVVGMIL